MSNTTEIVSHWIDAQPEGTLIRGQDLAHLANRDQASRQLARSARHGRLMRVARGVYVAVTASRFGLVPPPIDKVVQSLATITGRAVVRHGAAAANALGLTTQVPVRQVYLTDGRARRLSLGKQIIEIRHAPKWMLVLGTVPPVISSGLSNGWGRILPSKRSASWSGASGRMTGGGCSASGTGCRRGWQQQSRKALPTSAPVPFSR